MKIEVTDEFKKPHTITRPAVMVKFDTEERNVLIDGGKADWLPTFEEVLKIIEALFVSEDERYPKAMGFKGRDMFFECIKKVHGNDREFYGEL